MLANRVAEEVYRSLLKEIDENLLIIFQSLVHQVLKTDEFDTVRKQFLLIPVDVWDPVWKTYDRIFEMNSLLSAPKDESFFRRNDLWSILRNELPQLRDLLANRLAGLRSIRSPEAGIDLNLEEEKFIERLSLLKRLYWLDQLYEIGNTLSLPYFASVTQYVQLDHQAAAQELAAAVSDNELVSLNRKFPPKYVELGGFQGNHYSANEKGVIILQSSWDDVRGNAGRALRRHGERAYGVLQALVNVGGTSAFFALIPEIEKVIGYEFYPSTLLPKLSAYRLVFKTGSNKYPEWSIPSEIIVPLQEVLSLEKPQIRKREEKRVTENVSDEILRQEKILAEIADQVLQERRAVNLKFKSRFGFSLLRQDELATADIRKPCADEGEFNNRILTLSSLIDAVDTDALKKELLDVDIEGGAPGLIEGFFRRKGLTIDGEALTNLQKIKRLRSTKYPIHVDKPEFLESLNYFGFGYPPDWQELWIRVLTKYLESLQRISKSLE